MKKTLLLIIVLLASLSLAAQKNDIVIDKMDICFRDIHSYDLHLYFEVLHPQWDWEDYVVSHIDVDKDGTDDLVILVSLENWPQDPLCWSIHAAEELTVPNWEVAMLSEEDVTNDVDLSWPLLDYHAAYGGFSIDIWYTSDDFLYDSTETFHHGIRHRIVDDEGEPHFCYGWIDGNVRAQFDGDFSSNTLCLERLVYCPIPDYPLKYGQLSTAVGENEATKITLQPNPTSDEITVTGDRLRSIAVHDMLGRRVASENNLNGSTATVDLRHLPPGVYVVNVTEDNGTTHVSKVVKQ